MHIDVSSDFKVSPGHRVRTPHLEKQYRVKRQGKLRSIRRRQGLNPSVPINGRNYHRFVHNDTLHLRVVEGILNVKFSIPPRRIN